MGISSHTENNLNKELNNIIRFAHNNSFKIQRNYKLVVNIVNNKKHEH